MSLILISWSPFHVDLSACAGFAPTNITQIIKRMTRSAGSMMTVGLFFTFVSGIPSSGYLSPPTDSAEHKGRSESHLRYLHIADQISNSTALVMP